MKVIECKNTERGIEVFMGIGDHYYLSWNERRKGDILMWRKDHLNTNVPKTTRERITCAYVEYLHSESNTEPDYDKQVYFDKGWRMANFVLRQGNAVTVIAEGYGEMIVPFCHIRDKTPICEGCEEYVFKSSFQTVKGTSYCENCYQELDRQELELLFNGPQWMSWEGQMNMREMGQSHLVNSLARLKKSAFKAAEHAGGKPEDYLHPSFEYLVEELHRRRPLEEKVKINHYLLYVWSVLFMVFGWKRESE